MYVHKIFHIINALTCNWLQLCTNNLNEFKVYLCMYVCNTYPASLLPGHNPGHSTTFRARAVGNLM